MISELVKDNVKNEIKKALGMFNLPSRDEAVDEIIAVWEDNKGPLMELLSKHPNWNPDKFQIVFDTTFDREIDEEKSYEFLNWVRINVEWSRTLDEFYGYTEKTVSNKIVRLAQNDYPELRITEGQKTSRAVNKILTSLGFEGKEYNQRFAKYADAMNPLRVVRHTVISCHPVDYLLMSNGNSWSSCHTIDKHNSDQGYSGRYCSGTVSYMLDESSLVFYQVDDEYNGDCYEMEPKIVRQMFHYTDGVLIQGRLYPQSNDGKNSLYVPTREIMQKIFADCLGLPNLWRKKGGSNACKDYTHSFGTHYRDYWYNRECNVSRIIDLIPEGKDERKVYIGHDPICFLCGEKNNRENWLYCDECGDFDGSDTIVCKHCGRIVRADEAYYFDDGQYCEDCVVQCECCRQYIPEDKAEYINGKVLCRDCFDGQYMECDCGHYESLDEFIRDAHGKTYCRNCIYKLTYVEEEMAYYPDEEVSFCTECGEAFVGEGSYCSDCREEKENE